MYYNLINSPQNNTEQISRFYALNRTDKGNKNEFVSMMNMSSDHYPCLAPAKAMKEILTMDNIRAVIAPKYSDDEITSFTGVAGTSFYFDGNKIPFEADDMKITDGIPVTLVDFGGRIIICAYDADSDESIMYYYDYTASSDDTVKRMEKGVYDKSCTAYSEGNPDTDVMVTNYLQVESSKLLADFNVGDSVFISGFSSDRNNTVEIDSRYQTADKLRPISCIVEKIEDNKLYLQLYNYLGEPLVLKSETAKEVSIIIKIPTVNHVCVHNNRLWGTNPNGEYIYASKLGDPFNWNTFQGLSNDSFYAKVGTAGGFVGIVSYRDNLVALKRDYIHHIYGDKPTNFTIPKQLSDCGCIDIRSAVQIGTSLFFLGYGGFYEYTGGQPELISVKLGKKYKSAIAMTDGQKYIASCYDTDGNGELLVYDTRYGLWHAEKHIHAVGYFRWHDKLYIASNDKLFEYGALTPDEWECESAVMYESVFDNKGMTELWIRARIDDGGQIDVYTSEDGGDYLLRTTLQPKGLKVYRVPVRFIDGEYYQIKLCGKGNAVIYDIERVFPSGGRQYYREG